MKVIRKEVLGGEMGVLLDNPQQLLELCEVIGIEDQLNIVENEEVLAVLVGMEPILHKKDDGNWSLMSVDKAVDDGFLSVVFEDCYEELPLSFQKRIVVGMADLGEPTLSAFGLVGYLAGTEYLVYERGGEKPILKYDLKIGTEELVRRLQKLAFYVEYKQSPLVKLNEVENEHFKIMIDKGHLAVVLKERNRIVYDSSLENTEDTLKDLVAFGFTQQQKSKRLIFGEQTIAEFRDGEVIMLHPLFKPMVGDMTEDAKWKLLITMAEGTAKIMSIPMSVVEIE
ncbi:MAG: hypothetical protein ACRCZ0_04490 [Cetobacterium sp.]